MTTTNIEALVRPNIRRLTPYSSARSEYKGRADIFLDANENPFENGLNRYPDPLQWAVKERISAIKHVPVSQIALGNGSDEVIDLLIRIFCEPGEDHIITLPPTYGMYQVSADIANVPVKKVPLLPGFQPDVDGILAAADQHSKILFLCSPNNPTANSLDAGAIQQLIGQFPGIVAIDEAYIDFADQPSFTEQLATASNLVVMQTFSKAWGLAGIRLGMIFASEEIIGYFNKVKPPYNVNELTQRAALEALQKETDYEEKLQTIIDQRGQLTSALDQLDFVQLIYPSDANFVLAKVDEPQKLYHYLTERGIIVRDRSKVLMCEGCLRFTVGTPDENEQLMAALKTFEN
ncbi:histidinol-phosphate transaminase [Flavilitoribacter nigricans]|uniref:Histidinol-phosphate aminotransferase n=1 Tax=Flavilitoribacter nigricans (strain ATCC 23147 / DSM 23189 / NBRC 102662 / NCIMB 1420 / SS-2) TaxID=1122177 RepID=A0A2D0N3I4_FLAN2|nr:histidinol-phosphate transaminase [Flavilitoribacter nigricans]PHN03081.1 histidinol-phosphate transaminase [Flavilitoribacter nigricans DSM 23189 = NBRC 102662]